MTETRDQRIHAIVYSNDSREELGERIVALEDENARLRSCLSDDAENARLIMGENAKLRELAKAAWGCVKRQVSCDDCRIVACGCTLATAMRECGIEVKP